VLSCSRCECFFYCLSLRCNVHFSHVYERHSNSIGEPGSRTLRWRCAAASTAPRGWCSCAGTSTMTLVASSYFASDESCFYCAIFCLLFFNFFHINLLTKLYFKGVKCRAILINEIVTLERRQHRSSIPTAVDVRRKQINKHYHSSNCSCMLEADVISAAIKYRHLIWEPWALGLLTASAHGGRKIGHPRQPTTCEKELLYYK